MMKSQNSAIGRSHVVWLDVVRFVAMFTVVCCHSADPFNFYPGEPPANIDQIKFWGAAYGGENRKSPVFCSERIYVSEPYCEKGR